jgi:hypothetical protein
MIEDCICDGGRFSLFACRAHDPVELNDDRLADAALTATPRRPVAERESLAAEFATLARAATPGPWAANAGACVSLGTNYPHPSFSATCTLGVFGDSKFTLRIRRKSSTYPTQDDAEFIAWCGTNRERILEALRIAEVVRDDEAHLDRVVAVLDSQGPRHPDPHGQPCSWRCVQQVILEVREALAEPKPHGEIL